MASVHAYVCFGGPLNGQYASTEDFAGARANHRWVDGKTNVVYLPPGRFHDHQGAYSMFNRSDYSSPTKAIWIFKAWLVPAISVKTGKKVKA